jgi:hypothetical protein
MQRSRTTFAKGAKAGPGRPAGSPNKMTEEVNDMVQMCREEGMGGYARLLEWCKSSDKRLDAFYTRMLPKLLPKTVNVPEQCETKRFRTVAEVRAAFAVEGISLETIEKLKRIEQEEKEKNGPQTKSDALGQFRTNCIAAIKATYSIISSASADRLGGTSMPIAFAALRLITNSNLVGSITGKSAGLAPLSIRAAYSPACR